MAGSSRPLIPSPAPGDTAAKTAAVYIRVSTDDQAELSPDSQLETIRVWAEKNGYTIPGIDSFPLSPAGERNTNEIAFSLDRGECNFIFVDEGISGRSARKRPRFNDMIAMAKEKAHPFDTILLWKFSRFARNQEESIVYKAMLRRCGVDVISVSEPIIEGPFGSLIERIIEWMDEYYSIRLSGEVKRSMQLNAERGVRQAAPPFGYRKNPSGGSPFMLPQPEEAAVIREVYAAYLAGEPVWSIVEKLNARGIVTHRGGRIENRTVMYWLQNPVYTGQNRWTPSGKTRRDFRNPDTLTAPGDHEPLVSQEDFDAVQALAAAASKKWRPKSRPVFELRDWMGGIVRCADCGSTLVFQQPRYFVCNGYIRARCKSRQSITCDALHEAVLGKLRADLSAAEKLSFRISQADGSAEESELLRQQTEQLDRRLARARDAYAAGVDTLEEYKAFKDEISRRRQTLEARIAELAAEADPRTGAGDLHARIAAALETLDAPDIPLAEKNSAARELFERCAYDKAASTLSITYRIFI